MKSYITMGKLIALSFLFCLPLLLFLSINVHTNKMFSRNELARPVMGTIFLVLVLHCCSALLQNLVGNSEETNLEEEGSVDVPYPPLQIVNSIPFCLFCLYLYPLSAPFLNPLSSPSPPSLLSLLTNSLSS